VIFMQPHAYVSPRLYDSRQNVPTWNYVAVHAYGRPVLIEERAAKIALQQKLVRRHDAGYLTQMAEFTSEPPPRAMACAWPMRSLQSSTRWASWSASTASCWPVPGPRWRAR